MRDAGYLLERIQNDLSVSDVKSMKQIGSGVLEIRLWSAHGTFRVIYVSKLRHVVYVLHCFQKKSQATAQADVELTASRYKSLLRELGQ
jgi:phage-related protein